MQADTCDRARVYAENTLRALQEVLEEGFEAGELLDAVERYARDALYYVEVGDCDTALSAASYAEGLLDSLKYTGRLEPRWGTPEWNKPRVFVAGTFDIIHPGHVDLLRYAASLGKVYVVVARDSNVERIKGKRPVLPEEARLRVVESIRYVYEARLGDEKDIFKPLEEIRPDIVVLGPDQPFDPDKLSKKIEERTGKRPRVVRYPEKEEFHEGMRSSSDIIMRICCGSYCHSIGCVPGPENP